MDLTREQEALLEDGTPAEGKAMELLVALGTIYEADQLIPVSSVHVSGASYAIVGEAGLRFLEDFSSTGRVRVPTSVNPLGMDTVAWKEMGVSSAFADRQALIVAAYRRMGAEETWTCIPYQDGNRPDLGDHIAWAESSAVVFANSMLGARTNREGGPAALASAVTGLTPNYGLHLAVHRKATARVEVEPEISGFEYALLGDHVGRELGTGVPLLAGPQGSEDEWKVFGAALATSSDIDMFHARGVTPEWKEADAEHLPVLRVTDGDLKAAQEELTTARSYGIVAFGCPQLSRGELEYVAELMEASRPEAPVWVFTNRVTAVDAKDAVERIERRGGRVWSDTCPEVMPWPEAGEVGTSSAKAAVYLPRLCGQRVFLGRPED
ncbi:MAG: aconitase X catalytic domain-containing protein, partial [Thermoplasmata archaeon]